MIANSSLRIYRIADYFLFSNSVIFALMASLSESGGNTTFSENHFTDHSPLNGEIILGVSGVKDIEKDWDSKISGEIQGGKNPLYVLNYKDDGLGKITIKEGFSLWN